MTVTYLSSSGAAGTSATVVVPAPAGIVPYNLLIVALYVANGVTGPFVFPPDWTPISPAYTSTGAPGALAFATKIATAAEPASYTFTAPTSYASAVVVQYQGAISVRTAPVYAPVATSGTATTAPATTGVAGDAELVAFASYSGNTFTTPTGMTARGSAVSPNNTSVSLFDVAVTTATVPARSSTQSASAARIGASLILSPPSPAGSEPAPAAAVVMRQAVGHEWQAFTRDAGYRLSGGVPLISAKGVRRHLGVDACVLEVPFTPDAYGRLAPGCGFVITRDGVQQVSCMVGSSRQIGWDADSGQATITVQGLGDDQHLADRLVYPTPGAAPDAQTADYWTFTGPASSAMWTLIRDQAGPGAQAARRVPTLVMGADPAAGASRLWQVQWAPLLDTLTEWGVLSGTDLGVQVVTTPDGLRADVYAPRDLSAAVRFSADLANLTGWAYEQQPPSVTFAINAGPGTLRNRVRRWSQSANVADLAWGRRIEQFIDSRDEGSAANLQQGAADAIAQGVGTVSLSTETIDSPAVAYGTDWDLGDRVTVHVGIPGTPTAATVVDLVREIAFDVDSSGREKITPAVGNADAAAIRPGPTQQALAEVASGLARLTRNL